MDSEAIKGEEKKPFKHYLGKEQCLSTFYEIWLVIMVVQFISNLITLNNCPEMSQDHKDFLKKLLR